LAREENAWLRSDAKVPAADNLKSAIGYGSEGGQTEGIVAVLIVRLVGQDLGFSVLVEFAVLLELLSGYLSFGLKFNYNGN